MACIINTYAQNVGINASGAAPDGTAMLDVASTTKGFLAPRMTSAQRTAISSPATGLLVYQTDGIAGFYYYNGSSWTNISSGTGGGTVTSAGLSLPAQFSVTNSPVTSSGTLTAAWASQTANYVFAAPNGSSGTPTFRALVGTDIPTLNQNTTGTSANVTGTVAVANGGTGATTLTGYVKGTGTTAMTASATIPAADISGNITGNAANVTGTVAVANGGTGTTNGSITGTTALTFAAGGTNQNVNITPSGTGYTLLNGNVGIGTTSPAYKLDISSATGSGRQDMLRILAGNNTTGNGASIVLGST